LNKRILFAVPAMGLTAMQAQTNALKEPNINVAFF
jgi:hypothetical protein